MIIKYAGWLACGIALLVVVLRVGFGVGSDAGIGSRLEAVERDVDPLSGKFQDTGSEGHTEDRVSRNRSSREVRAEPISEAERLVLEGEASPAKVAAIAKAEAMVPQFRQLLKFPAEEVRHRTASLMDEVGDLRLLTAPLVSAIHEVLFTGSPRMVADYATYALERQGTPQSAGLLADLLHHTDGKVRASALNALKSMSEDKFDTPEEAEDWARNWRLTEEEEASLLE